MIAETKNNMTEMLCPQSMQPTDQLYIKITFSSGFFGELGAAEEGRSIRIEYCWFNR